MSERLIGVGVRGAGTVGGGVIRELQLHGQERGLELRGVAVKDPNRPDREFRGPHYTTDKDLLSDPRIRIIVEAPGGVAPEDSRDFMLEVINSGRSLVTPAKEPLALYAPELFAAARSRGVDVKYEGAVGGGISVINPMLERGKVDKVQGFKGIVNGTTNHILTQMIEKGQSYQDALEEAQAAGYAESDPSSDVEGKDAAYKLAILFMVAFNSWVDPRDISTRGITDITPADLEFAKEYITDDAKNGHTIKLLAIAKRSEHDDSVELRVTPALISDNHQLARISGVFNAVYVDWELAGPQMYTGRGAGRNPTTSAVTEDLVRARENLERGPDETLTLDQTYRIKDPADVIRGGFVRSYLNNVPESAGTSYLILGRNGLNIEYISYKRNPRKTVNGQTYRPDFVTFDPPVEQRKVDAALAALEESDRVIEHPVFIPFEG